MIIILHGAPASGKSTLAKALSIELKMPLISRDNITEWLMDVNSAVETDFSKFISFAGYELMFKFTQELSKGKESFIVEGCFNPEGAGNRLLKILGHRSDEIIEIFLHAPERVLIERYQKRAQSGQRHSAHHDDQARVDSFPKHLRETKYRPLGLQKKLLMLDTSEDSGSLELVLKQIQSLI